MKKKLLGFVAFAMAMTLTTTSAFAAIGPRARGTGDVDSDSQITANDVLKILKGLANNDAQADVDGNGIIESSLDANVAYKTVLQPKTVKEGLVFNIYATEGLNGTIPPFLDATKLGAEVKAGEKGMQEVDVTTAKNIEGVSKIKEVISEAVDAAAIKNKVVTDQLNKIYFKGTLGDDVYLRAENGWAMFCNALRFIVPMDKATAAIAKKDGYTDYKYYDPSTATAEETARYNALMKAKKLIVGNDSQPSGTAIDEKNTTKCDTILLTKDIQAIRDAFFEAIPPTVTAEEITKTAEEVLKITDTKYDFTIEYNGTSQLLKSDSVAGTQFLADLIELAKYDTKTMADYRNTFGDKVVFTAQNQIAGATPITAVLEVAEIAE